jgi:hypothetical protein
MLWIHIPANGTDLQVIVIKPREEDEVPFQPFTGKEVLGSSTQ